MQNVASIPLSAAALTLHYFCTAFTPTLRYFCVAFSMYLHCFCCASISTEFALRLHCICTAFAISTELHWFAIFGTWDSVALCHPLNYIRECKLFKRCTKIQIHITLTIRVNAHWWMSARPEKRCPALSRGGMHLAVMRKANEE